MTVGQSALASDTHTHTVLDKAWKQPVLVEGE